MTALRKSPPLALALALVVGSSCATYTERTDSAYRDFRAGRLQRSADQFADSEVTDSEFLSGVEAGTALLTAGLWLEARQQFERAARDVREIEDQALLTPNKFKESLSSFVFNDASLAYQGEGFERVFLHVMLALTYMAEGRVENVYVEARRANQLLETEEELYETDYEAGGLGHFLSAVAYELVGEPGEAYIDYARMAEKGVGLDLAGPALVRLATELGYDEERERWIRDFGPIPNLPEGAASIVVIAGLGVAPEKVEIRASIPTPDGLVNWSVPEYISRPQPIRDLVLELPRSNFSLRTAPLEDVEDIAERNLADRIAWIAAKSAARGLLKLGLTRNLEQEYDGIGRLVGEIFSLATERADLRSWRTLPAEWHAARAFVTPGQHEIVLDAAGGGGFVFGTYELEPGETMFLIARTVDRTLFAHPVGGRLVEPPTLGSLEPVTPLDPFFLR